MDSLRFLMGALLCAFVVSLLFLVFRRPRKARRAAAMVAALKRIDLSPVTKKFMRNNAGMSLAEARTIEVEFKCWMILVALHGNLGMPDSLVDDYWHLAICDTKLYRRLCQALTGKDLIHHDPSDGKPDGALKTFHLYRQTFGAEPNARAWSRSGIIPTPDKPATRPAKTDMRKGGTGSDSYLASTYGSDQSRDGNVGTDYLLASLIAASWNNDDHHVSGPDRTTYDNQKPLISGTDAPDSSIFGSAGSHDSDTSSSCSGASSSCSSSSSCGSSSCGGGD